MTEYWKSYAKKYCDVCKCWITDNKASVQFHENGKRHKENVTKKINDLVKKATREGKEKKELDEDMKKMEEAAMKAYMKDVEENPDHSAQVVMEKVEGHIDQQGSSQPEMSSSLTEGENQREIERKIKKLPKNLLPLTSDKVWLEAITDEGTSYYWNAQTNESIWDPPEEFMTLAEQNRLRGLEMSKTNEPVKEAEAVKDVKEEEDAALNREKNKKKYASQTEKKSVEKDKEEQEEGEQKKEEEKKEKKEEEKKEEKKIAVRKVGPQIRSNPYGAWTTVVPQKKKPVDLQLPPSYKPLIQQAAYTTVEPKVKIKEKTIDPSKIDCSDGPTNFKKRKLANRGNTRQRLEDDDE